MRASFPLSLCLTLSEEDQRTKLGSGMEKALAETRQLQGNSQKKKVMTLIFCFESFSVKSLSSGIRTWSACQPR